MSENVVSKKDGSNKWRANRRIQSAQMVNARHRVQQAMSILATPICSASNRVRPDLQRPREGASVRKFHAIKNHFCSVHLERNELSSSACCSAPMEPWRNTNCAILCVPKALRTMRMALSVKLNLCRERRSQGPLARKMRRVSTISA